MGLDARKPVIWVSDQVSQSAQLHRIVKITETISVASLAIIITIGYPESE